MDFLSNFFAFLKKWFESKFGFKEGYYLESKDEQNVIDVDFKVIEKQKKKNSNARRNLKTWFYHLRQEIEIFRQDYPEKYQFFSNKIDSFENDYNQELKESKEILTMSIDPEDNIAKRLEVEALQDEIIDFINGQFRAHVALKKMKILIGKSNLLYNESFKHAKSEDKLKVMKQLDRITKFESGIVKEVCENSFLVRNIREKEEFITLIFYEEYIIFKTALRNSEAHCQDLLDKMATRINFTDFDYVQSFKAFLEDELSDLDELIKKLNDLSKSSILSNELDKIYNILLSTEFKNILCDFSFWKRYQLFESNVIAVLRDGGYDSKVAKVQLLDKLNIDVNEADLLTSPKVTSYLALMSVFNQTSSNRIYTLTRIVEQLDVITYKDIYFLIVLFDALDLMKTNPNGLTTYLEKYDEKYNYGKEVLYRKKEEVLNCSYPNSDYALIFKGAEETIVKSLTECRLDIKIESGNDVYINMFYFKDLENVRNSFQIRLS